jgi:DNA-binding MarR family transcriptional regulator
MGSNLLGRRRHPSSSSDQARAILNDLRLLVRELRVSARDAEKRLGISGAQLFVLQCLGRDAVLSMNELAERTHTDQSSVSVVVSRLVERELVQRSASLEDARRAEVRLTASGRRLVRFAPEATQVRLAEALAAMSPEASERLGQGLSELVRHMGLDGAPRMFFEEDAKPAPARSVKHRGSRG